MTCCNSRAVSRSFSCSLTVRSKATGSCGDYRVYSPFIASTGPASYLVFQLWTHSYLYVPASATASNGEALSPSAAMLLQYEGPQPPTEGRVFRIPSWGSSTNSSQTTHSVRSRASSIHHHGGDEDATTHREGPGGPVPSSTRLVDPFSSSSHDPEKGLVGGLPPRHVETPKLSPWFALGLLVVVTGITVSGFFTCPGVSRSSRVVL